MTEQPLPEDAYKQLYDFYRRVVSEPDFSARRFNMRTLVGTIKRLQREGLVETIEEMPSVYSVGNLDSEELKDLQTKIEELYFPIEQVLIRKENGRTRHVPVFVGEVHPEFRDYEGQTTISKVIPYTEVEYVPEYDGKPKNPVMNIYDLL